MTTREVKPGALAQLRAPVVALGAQRESWRVIPLTQGYSAIIDEVDAPRVLKLKWNVHKNKYQVSAVASINGHNIYLHRFILEAQPGQVIDHINRDKLDNRRSNLRFCTTSQNLANRRAPKTASGYRGVRQENRRGKLQFHARVERGGRVYYGPRRSSAVEAAADYDALALHHYGEFAVLNFPDKAVRAALQGFVATIADWRQREVRS